MPSGSSVVEKLMDSAVADVDVLRALDSQGDDFSKFREVDFLFRCSSQEKAELVAKFINDYQYGVATTLCKDGKSTIQVIINMPVQQHIIFSIAGFMTCLAELYGIDFDGWGCVAQSENTSKPGV
jgi:regulator of RNase E activity RraB